MGEGICQGFIAGPDAVEFCLCCWQEP